VPVEVVQREVVDAAMASSVKIIAVDGSDRSAGEAIASALDAIRGVEASCSRFDPASDLARANASPGARHVVSSLLVRIVALALEGYRSTGGLFDPRVIADLEQLGYDRTFVEVGAQEAHHVVRPPRGTWLPLIDVERDELSLQGEPIDLGGVAKGAAVDLALRAMAASGVHGLVDLGGDGAVSGPDALGAPWSIGIEDPAGGPDPVAVFTRSVGGYATSSTRIRRWEVDGVPVHHLLDPRTGRPGGSGLRSVTVLMPTAAKAEVEAKAAFLAGGDAIARHAARRSLACLWVDEDGAVGWSRAMAPSLIWFRP
jgi:thiamine biosynthesis lipoprotein